MRGLVSSIWRRMFRAAAIRVTMRGSSLRGPVLWLTICGGVLVAAIFVSTVMAIDGFRERALTKSERELENTVLLLTRHFDQQFENAEVVAADLMTQLQLSEITSVNEFRESMSRPQAYRLLKSKVGAASYLGDIAIFDADGELINWSGDSPLPKVNISGRDYFRTFKSDPQSNPVLIETARSYISGKWTAITAWRLTGRGGVLLGVMTRRIEPDIYERYFASLALAGDTAISLLDRNGAVIARYPRDKERIGQNVKDAPLLWKILGDEHQQTLRLNSTIHGRDQLGSAARLVHVPIMVVATSTVSAALADWREQTGLLLAVAILFAAALTLMFLLIIGQINRQNREAQRRLEAERLRLDTALNNMTPGLVFFDENARMVTCNRSYLEMFDLSSDVVKPGCHFRDLIQHRRHNGSFDGDVGRFCAVVLKAVASGKLSKRVLVSSDGRAFQVQNQPLAQGGWVATVEDVTDRRRLEQERDRNSTFLRQIIDHIPSQITVKDARDRRYLLVNRVAEEMFGRSREEIVGKTAYELYPKAAAEIITRDDTRTLQTNDRLFLDEHAWKTQALGLRYITTRRIGIRDEAGDPRYIIAVVEDVTERRRAVETIAHLAHYDALTDLPNRVLFREQIECELQHAKAGGKFALLYIDIDEFKGINDSLGHQVGDELLKTIADRIRGCIKREDLIARLGGDEFAVIRTGINSTADVVAFIAGIHEAIRRPCQCLGHQLSTDASIGVALAPQDGVELDQLIKNADLAMFAAKADGRRTYRFFEPAMNASAVARLTMEQDLRQAVADGGFEIHYQPLVDLRSGRVSGCEALLRWRHPERGMISPAEFIPVAEDTGLIKELGGWVLRTACTEAATWPGHIRLAVNVSPVQLQSQTLALRIAGALAASGLEPSRLEIEITEAVLIRDDEAALATLHQLRAIGVRIALDDFGTGFSSLSYLKRFPFDKIKIDRCFVSDISEADGASSIVQAVVNIAAALHMTTVAEGVETEQQRALLRTLGCTEMQGYLFSAAKPADEVKRLFDAGGREASASA